MIVRTFPTAASRLDAKSIRMLAIGVLSFAMICAGCASGNGSGQRLTLFIAPPVPAAPSSTSPANQHDSAVHAAAASELGPHVAASMPVVPASAPPEPIDAGAAKIVQSITAALGDRQPRGDGVTLIDVRGVRNLSRSDANEFGAFMRRFGDVLTHAGRADRLAFTDDATAIAQYRMQGSAYMINADGFDQWEMYLTMTPADRDFDIWDAGSAVRVMRIVRPGVPQITFNGK